MMTILDDYTTLSRYNKKTEDRNRISANMSLHLRTPSTRALRKLVLSTSVSREAEKGGESTYNVHISMKPIVTKERDVDGGMPGVEDCV